MLAATNEAGGKSLAWQTEKKDGPFVCPGCLREAIIRKGKKRQHHFAHKQNWGCTYGLGESQIHYQCKREIYEALLEHPECTFCEMEKRLEGVRPDIFATVRGTDIAIEVQKTIISPEEVERRSRVYTSLGIYVFWFIPETIKILDEYIYDHICRPKQLERALHDMYMFRVYYWAGGLEFYLNHFRDVDRYIPITTIFSKNGEDMSVGGHYETYKSLKQVNQAPKGKYNLVDDFGPVTWGLTNIWKDFEPYWWERGEFTLEK